MINTNLDVHANKANGTTGFVSQIVLHDGEQPKTITMHGRRIPAVRAHQIKKIILEFENILNTSNFPLRL